MKRRFDRIATRLWMLSGLTSVITITVGISFFYLSTYFDLLDTVGRMPPKARAELEHLVATGQKGTDRFFELYDKYSPDAMSMRDWLFITIIVLASTAIGGSVALVLARRISRPITDVARAAVRVAAGDRTARVTLGGASGETGELVTSFNRMASDIEVYERERTVLTAGIAHELRTPLTILRGRLHGIIDGVIDPASGEADRLLRQVDQLSRIVEDLRTLAHAEAGELALDPRVVDLADVLGVVLDDLRPMAERARACVVRDLDTARVRADPVRLQQIAANLLTNAIKHLPPNGVITVQTWTSGRTGVVAVIDEGPGFDPADAGRMFMPFWRAEENKRVGRPGSGMGLALAAKLAQAQGGRITASNRTDRSGARFELHLPLA